MASGLRSVGGKDTDSWATAQTPVCFLCRSHIFWVDRKTPLWAVQVSSLGWVCGSPVELGLELCPTQGLPGATEGLGEL